MEFIRKYHTTLTVFFLTVLIFVFYGTTFDNKMVFDSTAAHLPIIYRPHINDFDLFRNRWVHKATIYLIEEYTQDTLFWHRSLSLIWHSLNSIFLFLLIKLLLGRTKEHYRWAALGSVVFFAFNPLNVYAVAYQAQKGLLLATLLSLLTTYLFLLGDEKKKAFLKISALATYFLALHTKEQTIVILGPIFVLTYFKKQPPLKEFIKDNFTYLVGFIVLAIPTLFQNTSHIAQVYEAHAEYASSQPVTSDVATSSPYLLSILNQAQFFFEYLLLLVLPDPGKMSIDLHFVFPKSLLSFRQFIGILSFFCLPMVCLFQLFKRKPFRLLWLGLLSFWLLFLPELSVVRISEPFVLYRVYLWTAFGTIALVDVLYTKSNSFKLPIALSWLIFLGFVATDRLATFESPIFIWQDAINKLGDESAPGAYRPYNSMGFAVAAQGDKELALPYIKKALQLAPNYPMANYNMGNILQTQGNLVDAVKFYQHTILYKADYADAHNNLGTVLIELGNFKQAAIHLLTAQSFQPSSSRIQNNLGALFARMGDWEKAIEHYEQALGLEGPAASLYNNLGQAYDKTGDNEKAFLYYKKAVEADPKSPDPFLNMGQSRYQQKKYSEAIEFYNKALDLNPNNSRAYFYLANAEAARKQSKRAISYLKRAIKLNVTNLDAHYNLGVLLGRTGRMDQAKAAFQSCLAQNKTYDPCIKGLNAIDEFTQQQQ